MSPVNLLFFLLFVPFSHQNALPVVSSDTANAYIRSFLPWFPKNEDFSFRTTPTPQGSGNSTEIVGSLLGSADEKENATVSAGSEEELDPSMLRVHDVPPSPLDELSPDDAPKSFADNSISNHDGNFIINFDEMGECPRDCSSDLREALSIVLQDMSHVERYHRICEKYANASTCVNEDARCDKEDRGMFDMMTSGLHYMCVEQELAFNATIKCIDDEAGLVQSECDAQCQTKNLFMNWMMRTAMQDTIQQGVNGIVGAATGTNANPLAFLQGAEGGTGGTPTGWADMLANIGQKPATPQDAQQGLENFRQFTNDLCRIGDCMLDCIRSKFNTRCEGSAGTLLSEVFVRPIAASQNKLSILRPVLGSFMPEQCAYLHNNADLKKHRIDSTMDEELKRMYAEKMAKEIREKTEQDELLSNLVPLDENGVPLPRALPELRSVDSPLDVSAKTLDQLILDMYSKNESKALNISEKNNETATFLEPENKEEQVSRDTLDTTEKSAGNLTEESTLKYEDDVELFSEASGEASGDGSKTENTTEASGEEYSGSSGEASGLQTDDDSDDGDGNSGEEFSWSSGQASGDLPTFDTSNGFTDNFNEASGESSTGEETSGSSGQGSGQFEASGQDMPPLTSVFNDTTLYNM